MEESQHSIEELIPILEKRILENPKDFEAHLQLGIIAIQLNQFEFASELINKAAQLNPRDSRPLYFLGFIQEYLGNFVEAERLYRSGVYLENNLSTVEALTILFKKQKKYGDLIKLIEEFRGAKLCEGELYNLIKESSDNILDSIKAERHPLRLPILLVGHGHAAGAFISVQLRESLNLMEWTEQPVLGSMYNAFFSPSLLDRFVKLGGVIHSHINSSPENIKTLEIAGLEKFLVLVREPRQSLYSITVWNEEVKRRSSDPGISRYESGMLDVQPGKNYYTLNESEKLDFMIETELPNLIRWVEGWLEYSEGPILKGKLLKFEDFKTNPNAFYESIIDFYGVTRDQFKLADIPCAPKSNGRPGGYGMRKGSFSEWREHVTPAQTEKMNSMIPPALMKRLGYEF